MKEFISKYEARIHGVLSCFDRMLFRGYLPIISGWQMAQFFNSSKIRFRELKAFLVQHAERVKQHAIDVAKHFGKGTGFGLGLAFLGAIFYPILGFGDATYGPSAPPPVSPAAQPVQV